MTDHLMKRKIMPVILMGEKTNGMFAYDSRGNDRKI